MRGKVESKREQSGLTVALVGPVAAGGMEQIQKNLVVGCSFRSFSKTREDKTLLKELEQADVVVSQYFSKDMAVAAGNIKLLHSVGAGIDDFYLPGLSPTVSVANVYFHGAAIGEFVMMMVLALSRELVKVDSELRAGTWYGSWISGAPAADEIRGKVLGVIGFGHIGRDVAARARAFGMKVWALRKHTDVRKPKTVDYWGVPEDLHDLLRESDYVVLACPLNEATEGLIGKRELGWMKSTASLINIARAAIVDEAALYRALYKRQIRSAAIDVWYRYASGRKRLRPSSFPFHKLDNLIMTPHIAGWTSGTFDRRFRAIADNIDRLASGRPLLNVVHGPAQHKLQQGFAVI